jgi:hypothetical protein
MAWSQGDEGTQRRFGEGFGSWKGRTNDMHEIKRRLIPGCGNHARRRIEYGCAARMAPNTFVRTSA